ncbi:MAG TPA: DUF4094 domain-containing protein [Candidatus Onthousia faecavium]|nr:DUF4094 domain-containing protein [Candidatus Onthousia faecavium]
MKKYQKNTINSLFSIILLILTTFFFGSLLTTKIWTYQSFNIIKETELTYQILTTKKNAHLLEENNYLYHNNEKYLYKVNKKEEISDSIILELKLNKDITNLEKNALVMIPKVKKTLFKIIIESWEDNNEENI